MVQKWRELRNHCETGKIWRNIAQHGENDEYGETGEMVAEMAKYGVNGGNGEMAKFKDKLPENKTAIIYLYCAGGPMGNAAARSLYALGYQNLVNLEGGADAWRKAGLPLQ